MANTCLFSAQQSIHLKIADAITSFWRSLWKMALAVAISWFVHLDWPSIVSIWAFLALLGFTYKTTIAFCLDGIYEETNHWFFWGKKDRQLLVTWWQINGWQVTAIGTHPLLLIDTVKGAVRVCPSGTQEQVRQQVEEAQRVLTEQYHKNIL